MEYDRDIYTFVANEHVNCITILPHIFREWKLFTQKKKTEILTTDVKDVLSSILTIYLQVFLWNGASLFSLIIILFAFSSVSAHGSLAPGPILSSSSEKVFIYCTDAFSLKLCKTDHVVIILYNIYIYVLIILSVEDR